MIGVARQFLGDAGGSEELAALDKELAEVQSRLLDVGSAIATPAAGASKHRAARVAFAEGHVEELERGIDGMDDQLPQLTQFILPSGGKASAFLHVARTVCRRAERSALPLCRAGGEGEEPPTDPVVLRYLNRLSDYLFTAARFAAMKGGFEETCYRKA